jgi:transposase-like protein
MPTGEPGREPRVVPGSRRRPRRGIEIKSNALYLLPTNPKLAIGDGALGFWKALPQVFGHTQGQRCWVHETANVLNKLPKSQQPKAKAALQEIWMAASREEAHRAFDRFIVNHEAKYPKAAASLVKDREALLAFYDFPAEHWVHMRTTTPSESTFATVRLRTAKTRGCVSRQTNGNRSIPSPPGARMRESKN